MCVYVAECMYYSMDGIVKEERGVAAVLQQDGKCKTFDPLAEHNPQEDIRLSSSSFFHYIYRIHYPSYSLSWKRSNFSKKANQRQNMQLERLQ